MIQNVYANQATAVATYQNGATPATVTAVSNIETVYRVSGPNWIPCCPSVDCGCTCCDCCSAVIAAVPVAAVQGIRTTRCSCGGSCGCNSCGNTCGCSCVNTCGCSCVNTCGSSCGNTCGCSCGNTCGSSCGNTCGCSCVNTCGSSCGNSCGCRRTTANAVQGAYYTAANTTYTTYGGGQALYDSPYAGFAAVGSGFQFDMAERTPYLRPKRRRSFCCCPPPCC